MDVFVVNDRTFSGSHHFLLALGPSRDPIRKDHRRGNISQLNFEERDFFGLAACLGSSELLVIAYDNHWLSRNLPIIE